MTSEEAVKTMTRGYRVAFDCDPDEFAKTMIDLASDRVSRGDFFSWEETHGKVRRLTFSRNDAQGQIVPVSEVAKEDEDKHASEYLEIETDCEVSAKLPAVTRDARNLSKRQQDFCRHVALGLPVGRAYELAGFGVTNRASANAAGSRLARSEGAAEYIRSLKQATWMKDVVTLAEKRNFLAQVIRTPVGEVNANNPLAQEVKRKSHTDKQGNTYTEEQIKMPGKLEALKLDAQLAGELKEDTQQANIISLHLLNDRIKIENGHVIPDNGMIIDQPVLEQNYGQRNQS